MLVNYLEKDILVFRVYGFADVKNKKKRDVKKPVQKPALADQSTNDSINLSMSSQPMPMPVPRKSDFDPLAAQKATSLQA